MESEGPWNQEANHSGLSSRLTSAHFFMLTTERKGGKQKYQKLCRPQLRTGTLSRMPFSYWLKQIMTHSVGRTKNHVAKAVEIHLFLGNKLDSKQ